MHNDYVCKGCGWAFETDEEWCAPAADGIFERRRMEYCPLCGYPKTGFNHESVGDWAFSCMGGCDEPEFSMYSAISDAVERYKAEKVGKLKKNSLYGKQAADSRRYAHGDIECIDAIKAALSPGEWRGFIKGNVLKYVWREAYKGGDCDLRKALDYLERCIKKGGCVEPVEEA